MKGEIICYKCQNVGGTFDVLGGEVKYASLSANQIWNIPINRKPKYIFITYDYSNGYCINYCYDVEQKKVHGANYWGSGFEEETKSIPPTSIDVTDTNIAIALSIATYSSHAFATIFY